MSDNYELKNAVHIRMAMGEYQDNVYLNVIRKLNTNCIDVLKDDLGSEFVKNCGRDLAGEVVRNCFDTSNYNITVDQLSKRILEFSYDDEYDPLADNGSDEQIKKNVYNYNELKSSDLDNIAKMMDESQKKLFTEDRKQDSLDKAGKQAYRESRTDENGDIYDELTGRKGTTSTYEKNGKKVTKSDLQADHVQARESATYNSRFLKEEGVEALKEFWNSSDNMQMIHASANASKGDIRVCNVNGKIKYVNARSKEYDASTDITYKATPEQLADAVCSQWESKDPDREGQNSKKIQKLKDEGYLDENGKVPKSVKSQLVKNIRHSQNQESIIALKKAKYKEVSKEAAEQTKKGVGKIIAGQVIYYAAPPLVYETRLILTDKNITINNALDKLKAAGKRIGEYVISKLKDIFVNVVFNSLKKFIKSFMDILINLVKATVMKIMKIAKNLLMCTVDAVRIIADKNSSRPEKADAVFNLVGVTITSCVIEILFELAGKTLNMPDFLSDIVFGPLQILTTVVCTNLTMLILKKLDLFDVRFGFKMAQIGKLFAESRDEYRQECEISREYADNQIAQIIDNAKKESYAIYENLMEFDPKTDSARPELEKINKMFSMNIDFEKDWLSFIGVPC